MISRQSSIAVATAVTLHAVLLALVLTGVLETPKLEHEPPTVVVQLLQPEPPRPPRPEPPKPPPPEPPKPTPPKPQPPRPEPPKPTPAPVAPAAPVAPPPPTTSEAPTRPAPPTPPTPTAPPPAPAPPAPPPPPAPPAPAPRTEVNISASYAASNAKPVYPAMSKRLGEQGTVVLYVLVRHDGTAGNVEVKSSSGYPRLDQSAVDAVRTWRFNPATVDGKAIDERYTLQIPFKLQN